MNRRRVVRWLQFGAVGVLLRSGGCDSPIWPFGDVHIRVANASAFAFERVDAVFPENAVSYGAVPANGTSPYRQVSKAYRYAYIEVQVAGEVLVLQPIDYVGERPLSPGHYTYVLNVTVEGHLTLELRED